MNRTLLLYVVFASLIISFSGCQKPPEGPANSEEPIVLKEGSTEPNPDYYVDEEGKIIYKDAPAGQPEDSESLKIAPVFPGAQRIYPADENPELSRSFITRASFELVREYYNSYLATGIVDLAAQATEKPTKDEMVNVNSVDFKEKDGSRKVTLYVNLGNGERGGMKVFIKEYPAQKMVQIVLSRITDDAITNAMGYFATPEEVQKWADEAKKAEEAEQKRRKEKEEQAKNREEKSGEE